MATNPHTLAAFLRREATRIEQQIEALTTRNHPMSASICQKLHSVARSLRRRADKIKPHRKRA